jgi:hypothetical protein
MSGSGLDNDGAVDAVDRVVPIVWTLGGTGRLLVPAVLWGAEAVLFAGIGIGAQFTGADAMETRLGRWILCC